MGPVFWVTYSHWTPLHSAKTLDVAMALVEARADVNACASDLHNQTPLHTVQRADIAQFLVDKKADVNSLASKLGCFQVYPLHNARNVDIARVLIQARANVNAECVYSRSTPLHTAKDDLIAGLLVDSGANVDCVNKNGETPLLLALKANDLARVECLVHRNADVNAVDPTEGGLGDKLTLLHRAIYDKVDISIVKCLLENKANVNVRSEKRKLLAPLHLVSNVDQCKLLIKHGANVTVAAKNIAVVKIMFSFVSLIS